LAYCDLGRTKAKSRRKTNPILCRREGAREERPAKLMASDEPAARQMDTCGPAGPPERGGRGQETVAERVNPKEREPAVIEKRPNEANLLSKHSPNPF
jgi:hypothetical protein